MDGKCVVVWCALAALPASVRGQSQSILSVSASGLTSHPCAENLDRREAQRLVQPSRRHYVRPNHYSEEESYAAPIDNLGTYPLYHSDLERPGSLESLRKRGPLADARDGKSLQPRRLDRSGAARMRAARISESSARSSLISTWNA
jgi:hypothetical protein